MEPSSWLERWQTLVAGSLAIVAALVGGAFLRAQMGQVERLESETIPSTVVSRFCLPALPNDLVSRLKDLVENGDTILGLRTASLLADLQVQRSRLQFDNAGGAMTLVLKSYVERYLINAANIHAKAASLLKQSRDEGGYGSGVTRDELLISLRSLGVDGETDPRIIAYVDATISEPPEPWYRRPDLM